MEPKFCRDQLLAFRLTLGNTDRHKSVPELRQGSIDELLGDRGYIARKLFERPYQQGLQGISLSSTENEIKVSETD